MGLFGTGKGLAHNYKRCRKTRCREPLCQAARWGWGQGNGAGFAAGHQAGYSEGYEAGARETAGAR